MSKQKGLGDQLLAECNRLTESLYGISYWEYTDRRYDLPDLSGNREKIRLDMYERILRDGWLHED